MRYLSKADPADRSPNPCCRRDDSLSAGVPQGDQWSEEVVSAESPNDRIRRTAQSFYLRIRNVGAIAELETIL
jgi:hypothetical protein